MTKDRKIIRMYDAKIQTMMRESALKYHSFGLNPIPVIVPEDGACTPILKGWTQRNLTESEIEEIWSDDKPVTNVGIKTDKSFCAVDIDDLESHGKTDATEGELRLRAEIIACLADLETPMVRTTGNGRHVYLYPAENDWAKATPLMDGENRIIGVDFIGHGSMVVAPPSIKIKNGEVKQYQFTKRDLMEMENRREFEMSCEYVPWEIQKILRAWKPKPKVDFTGIEFSSDQSTIQKATNMIRAQKDEMSDNELYKFIIIMLYRARLPEDEAISLLMTEYAHRCTPAWEYKQIQHKVREAWIWVAGHSKNAPAKKRLIRKLKPPKTKKLNLEELKRKRKAKQS